ncbi:MAG TPA: transcriptional initiation protein Tat [Rhodoblastus sp.]|nr:transcriptional initiation protein Tat [Rhodoblastus sp.]
MTDLVMRRRDAMLAMGLGLAAGLSAETARAEAAKPMTLPAGSETLAELAAKLAKAPRRRDYKTVPMILTDKNYWDHEALAEVMAYRGSPKQAWDNTDIAGPWINGMRNSMNAQVFGFKHPNFFVVSATHGTAHLALLDQAMWDKYQLTKLAGEKFPTNTFLAEQPGASMDAKDFENPEGVFSGHNLSIPALMRRGVVFLACHNTMWEVSEKLLKANINPDKLSHDAMAAELTNHIIPSAVLTPGIVGTIPELAAAGFTYLR